MLIVYFDSVGPTGAIAYIFMPTLMRVSYTSRHVGELEYLHLSNFSVVRAIDRTKVISCAVSPVVSVNIDS